MQKARLARGSAYVKTTDNSNNLRFGPILVERLNGIRSHCRHVSWPQRGLNGNLQCQAFVRSAARHARECFEGRTTASLIADPDPGSRATRRWRLLSTGNYTFELAVQPVLRREMRSHSLPAQRKRQCCCASSATQNSDRRTLRSDHLRLSTRHWSLWVARHRKSAWQSARSPLGK